MGHIASAVQRSNLIKSTPKQRRVRFADFVAERYWPVVSASLLFQEPQLFRLE